jgi:arginine deiminase
LLVRLREADERANAAERCADKLQGSINVLVRAQEDQARLSDKLQQQAIEITVLQHKLRAEQDLRQRQVREAVRALQSPPR